VVNAPAEFNEYDVSTVAVDAFADVIEQEIEPVADRLIVDVTLVPCVTVTSFVVPVTSAVTSSAPNIVIGTTTSAVMASVKSQLNFFLNSCFMIAPSFGGWLIETYSTNGPAD